MTGVCGSRRCSVFVFPWQCNKGVVWSPFLKRPAKPLLFIEQAGRRNIVGIVKNVTLFQLHASCRYHSNVYWIFLITKNLVQFCIYALNAWLSELILASWCTFSFLWYRIDWVGRDLKSLLIPTPCYEQGQFSLDQIAQSSIKPCFEHFQGCTWV